MTDHSPLISLPGRTPQVADSAWIAPTAAEGHLPPSLHSRPRRTSLGLTAQSAAASLTARPAAASRGDPHAPRRPAYQ